MPLDAKRPGFLRKTLSHRKYPKFNKNKSATLLIAVIALVTAIAFSVSVESRTAGWLWKTQPSAPAEPAKNATAPSASVNAHLPLGPNAAALAPVAPVVTASKTDALFTDVDMDGKADPGDTLKYTVSIGVSGMDATAVQFNDTVDPNTNFLAGTLRTTPIARNDSYTATGNVRISVAAPGVLGNDSDADPAVNALTATAGTFLSAQGGNVTLNADGSFTYNPAPGFEGNDSFTYTLNDNDGEGATDTATATITVSGMIWFINNNAVCPCDGRLTNPFNTLAAFQAVNDGVGNHPAANDNIFVYESATDYVGPVTLLNGQKFIGQDATATLASITGITLAPGSDPLPATNSGNGTIVNITGDGITVAQNNTLRGFTGGDATTDISGTGFGTLNVSDVTLNGNGRALNLTTGTLNGTFGSISSTNSATTGISLSGVGGTLTTGSTTVTNSTGIGISVSGSGGTFNFAATSVTGSGNTGISLTTNTGPFTFGALTITPDANQRGLLATDNSANITIPSGTVTTSGGVAVEITRASGTTPLTVSLTSVSANGGTGGIVLSNTNGSFTITGNGNTTVGGNSSGGTIQNVTGHAIAMTNVQNPSFTNINIQSAGRSGVDGQQVTNFILANSTINNVGTAAVGQHDESNISFNDNGTFTTSSVSGVVSITQNTLTNARRHGIQIENGSGTVSNLTITNNTLTSSTSSAVSLGTGILIAVQGSAGTTAHLTTGNISNNTVTNFPSGEGIAVLGGSGNTSNNTSSTLGANGTPISITNNTIAGQAAAASHLGSNAIRASMNSQVGVMNVNIACNGKTTGGCTATGPITNIQGQGISVFAGGTITGTTTIDNNVIIANQTLGAGTQGLAFQVDDGPAGLGTSAANYNVSITNNSVSNYEGNGIRAIARASLATLDVTIQNNNVGIPSLANRNGIRVDSGSSAGDVTVCMNMTGNTTDGSGVNAGIGLRKQGTVATTNDFGIVGLAPSPATAAQAQAKVTADNPASVGGVDIISGDNFVSCAQTARNNKVPVTSGVETRYTAMHKHDSEPVTRTVAKPQQGIEKRSAGASLASLPKTKRENSGGTVASYSRANSWVKNQPLSAHAQQDKARRGGVVVKPGIRPTAGGGETVTHSVGTLLAGKTVRIQFQVTVNTPYAGGPFVTNQGTVSGSNFTSVLTDDPAVGGANDPTQTPVLQIPNVSVADAQANEPATGTAPMLFTISLSAPAPAAGASVHYATADQPAGPGHAVAGVDYVAIPETPLNFAGGEQVKVVTVTILSDAASPEPDETFLLNLTNAANAVIVDSQAIGTIKQGNAAGTFLISEFRTSGPGGEGDDFVEVYNNSDSPLTVAASDASSGYGLFKKGANCSANPILIGVIPNGTVIPARGHYLFVGSAYSLANYGGTGAAAGDQTLSQDIEWDTNIAIFNTTEVANLSSVTRLDAVGFFGNIVANCILLSEGATVTPPAASVLEFSFNRDQCGKKGNPAIFGPCPTGGLPADTNDNANDFVYSDTTGAPTPQGQRLGAPGPENLASPRLRNATTEIIHLLLDSNFGAPTAPNRVRNLTPVTNGANGTLAIRRRFVNNTGAPVTRLRFRIVDISTVSVPGGIADLRALTSTNVVLSGITDSGTCTAAGQSTPCTITVQGTTLETPPAQANGGGNNSTLTVTLGTPLAAGASINVQFLLGVQQTGSFKFFFNIEALP